MRFPPHQPFQDFPASLRLENVKLFNSNLDVVDEAFEYLINQTSKGEKGQYFTPRYVIDMCVKMLNPQAHESLIDTAAGSSGFPVHAMFYVWRQIYRDEGQTIDPMFSAEEKLPACEDYVREKVFAIDFDEKAVRVARTLNLIAGDGQTNVLYLNTLDYEMWDERIKDDDWRDVYNDGFKRLRGYQTQKGDYKAFGFDLVMANPPFAGEIKEQRITAKYDLALKPNGKRAEKMGRDILFIERNLDCLKPGGRMAVVLPQGRFNNSSDKHIRDVIAERCRILAVVGLHGNTFKPHTGTKTSVLFVQKWNDDPKVGALCPRVEDYNIFFATMRKSGKDNSGDKIYVKKSDGSGEFLLDEHGHLMVDHDLFNHDGLTQDGIAEAFIEFAKKEKLSFFKPSPSVTPFDQAKYDRLMDGLEAVEVTFADVLDDNDSFRFDSEYFRIDYIVKLKRIQEKQYRRIGDFAYVTDGIHESIEFDEESEINLISAKSPKENVFDLSGNSFISLDHHLRNPRTALQEGDVIISTVGTIGNCAVVDKTILPANSDRHVGIVRIEKEFKPYFLSTFLLSKYGKFQTLRESTGNVQLNLFIYKIKTLKVPHLSNDFQDFIDRTVKTTHQILKQSKVFYQQAEELLLSELGLNDWQPIADTIAVKRFSDSWGGCDRGDAEYYQPQQQQVMATMHRSGLRIQDIARLAKRKFQSEKQGTFNYIEIGNLSGEGFANSEVVEMEDAPSRAQWIVEPNDVITSTVRPIRRLSALIEEDQDNFVCSSGFAVLEPIGVEPEVLLVYLRLPVVCEILDLHTTASMYPAISTEDLLDIPVTLPNNSVCQKVKKKVRASRTAREQSKQLLEIAKTGVERAIEEDEERAIDWMNEQLKALGIDVNQS